MYSHSLSKNYESGDCTITLRRVQGPEATELFLACCPTAYADSIEQQTKAIYQALGKLLENEGTTFASVVSETAFLRNLAANLEGFRTQRKQALIDSHRSKTMSTPAILEIEQAPLNERAQLEVSIQAIFSNDGTTRVENVELTPAKKFDSDTHLRGVTVIVGNETRFYASNICGQGKTAYEQTQNMLRQSEELLREVGMTFSDVMRTWIHLREIDRDYAALNLARREFFNTKQIDPVPASTGIEGGQTLPQVDLCLGIYAVREGQLKEREVMTSATLNEAEEYGADFVRGMKVTESNKIALLVSGTASVNEAGETAHIDDFEAQADRMLVNVAALLDKQGASFKDIVSATTYLKDPVNTARLMEKFQEAGFIDFPNVLVEARVCRPNLLCETEVLAVLPI